MRDAHDRNAWLLWIELMVLKAHRVTRDAGLPFAAGFPGSQKESFTKPEL